MKLFIWRDVKALVQADYAMGGVSIAVADSREVAIGLLLLEYRRDRYHRQWSPDDEAGVLKLKAELESTDPEVHESTFAINIEGSA